jgi:hypothetical protein
MLQISAFQDEFLTLCARHGYSSRAELWPHALAGIATDVSQASIVGDALSQATVGDIVIALPPPPRIATELAKLTRRTLPYTAWTKPSCSFSPPESNGDRGNFNLSSLVTYMDKYIILFLFG